jgi:phage gp46-like protein
MDIAIEFNGTEFDIGISKGDLKKDEGLETAVIISLFTNQRVAEDDLPALETRRGGWWADDITEISGDQIGSKLWLLDATKLTETTLDFFETYANEALGWMIEDGLASAISTIAERVDNDIKLSIEITKNSDENILLAFLWDGQKLKRG